MIMSENNFDDNIRKKLESIRPEYSEAAWQKLKRSLPIPWYMSFLRDYGGWAFGGLATVAFLGSQYDNQTIRKENKLLNEKISILNTSPEIKTITDTVYVRQNDTVYTTRYVTRYIKVGDDYQLDEKQLTESQKRLLAEKTRDKSVDGKVQIGVATRKTNSKVGKDNSSISSAVGSEKLVSGETVADKNLNETNLAFQANKVEDKVVAEVSDDKLKPARVEDISKETQDEAKPTKEKVEENELIIPENKAQLPTDQKKPKKIDLSRINARFGISGDYMGHQFNSLGPAVEVFLGERFSVNSGLLITGKREYEYRLLRDFNMNTGKQFEDRYRPFIKEKPMKIENIEIETSSIKLPIFVSYYVPLRYNLDFMLSTGTKLDLSVIETVKFSEQAFDGSNYYNKFENQYKPKVFNNLFYGMGIQYKYKRFVGQVNPYFEFPFRQANYLMPPKKFGVNASLKFSLKK
jgi:hypothetical protein